MLRIETVIIDTQDEFLPQQHLKLVSLPMLYTLSKIFGQSFSIERAFTKSIKLLISPIIFDPRYYSKYSSSCWLLKTGIYCRTSTETSRPKISPKNNLCPTHSLKKKMARASALAPQAMYGYMGVLSIDTKSIFSSSILKKHHASLPDLVLDLQPLSLDLGRDV